MQNVDKQFLIFVWRKQFLLIYFIIVLDSATVKLRGVRPKENVRKNAKVSNKSHTKSKIKNETVVKNETVANELPILKSENKIKEEDKEGELSSSVSSTSDPLSPGESGKEEV